MSAQLSHVPRALANLERAAELLETCRDVPTLLEIRNVAKLAAEYARVRRVGVETFNHAMEVQLKALRRLGEFLDAEGPRRGRPKKNVDGVDIFATLEQHGISRDESSRAQKLYAVSDADFELYLARVQGARERLTLKGALTAASFAEDYDGDEHYTPTEYVEAARAVMGSIDCDPASCELAQRNVRAKRFYTKRENGLEREWRGNVLLNSPFSRGNEAAFTEKLLDELDAKRTAQCFRVMNATTDTASFHATASRGLTWFPKGRIAFYVDRSGELVESDGNRTPQAIHYIGRRHERFEREMLKRFGGLVGKLRG